MLDSGEQRIARKVNGVITEKYLWAGLTGLLAVYDASDTLIARFEYADGPLPVKTVQNGTTYYLAYDQVGSLRAVLNANGAVVHQIAYDTFGNILSETASGLRVPFGFAGGLHDRATGLVRFGYRDYDPDTGRWTAKDPIGFGAGAVDLYEYCGADPVGCIDPVGLTIEDVLYYTGNFAAGVGDTLTFGLTDMVREAMGTNSVIDRSSGAYIGGVAFEFGAELALTGGGAALRHAAAKTSHTAVRNACRRLTRKIPRNGGELAHINPLYGHPGRPQALFPTAGLPAWIHSGPLNTRVVSHAKHQSLHRKLRMEEDWFKRLINPNADCVRFGSHKIRLGIMQ